jgi:cytochrome oxidase assembly protein ShyY1
MGGKEAALRPMLVSNTPAPGLEASAPPSPDEVPNNHLAYAVQWFLFAGVAALIYGLALRRRASAS